MSWQRGAVGSLLWRLQSAAAFLQLGLLSADGLIKQVVLKQVKMDAQWTRVPGLGSSLTSQQISLCLDQNSDFDSPMSWMSRTIMNPLKAKLAGLCKGRGGRKREVSSESCWTWFSQPTAVCRQWIWISRQFLTGFACMYLGTFAVTLTKWERSWRAAWNSKSWTWNSPFSFWFLLLSCEGLC